MTHKIIPSQYWKKTIILLVGLICILEDVAKKLTLQLDINALLLCTLNDG